MSNDSKEGLTYKDAGVDIEAADSFVGRVGWLARSTFNAGVVQNPAAYASLFRPDLTGISKPLIAATCDGVGTKLMVAREMGMYEGLGQDLVAMNVNDLLPSGAKPLFFLDYIATGSLEVEALEAVVRGIAHACTATGCALVGGETAEMPGVYGPGEFDLAGFAVGLADEATVPSGHIGPGDIILALPSSGIHSNGLSLARAALFDVAGLTPHTSVPELGRTLGEELLEPTRLYVNQVLDLLASLPVKACAHITGGGLLGRAAKLSREGLRLVIHPESYRRPPIFELIGTRGSVRDEELARTFNMGLGFLAVVSPSDFAAVRASLSEPWLEVGHVESGAAGVDLGYASS